MNKLLFIAVLTTLPLSMPFVWAEDAHHSGMDKSPASTMTDKDKQMQMGKMQEHMFRMHEQMHKIMDAKNPQDRERLMQEHSKMMQDGMHMKGMMGDHGMMGGDAKDGRMNGGMKGM